MIRRLEAMAMVATALALAAPARAHGVDPLRCEAVAMRKDGQRYDCLGRCERRHARQVAAQSARIEDNFVQCRQGCEDRYIAAMEQLDARDICSPPDPEPDPNRCQSRLLRVGAARLVCKSQCSARADGSNTAECMSACDEQCARAAERIMAKDFCLGHAATDVCVDHLEAP